MSDARPRPTPDPPPTSGSPFGKFQTVSFLAVVILALVVAMPFVVAQPGGSGSAPSAPAIGEDGEDGGGGSGGGDGGSGNHDQVPTEPQDPAPTRSLRDVAHADCISRSSQPGACDVLLGPDGEPLAEIYLDCREQGRPADECLAEAGG